MDEGVARDLKPLIVTDLQAGRVVAVDGHQDHESGLEEGGDDDGENDAEDLDPELIVQQAQHDHKAENSIAKVGNDTELKDHLELRLHAILSFGACAGTFKVAALVIAGAVFVGLDVHGGEEGAHSEKYHAVDDLADDQLLLIVLIHFLY